MAKHKQVKRKDGSIRYEELPQRKHAALVKEYWKTWLAAQKVRVKSEDALDDYVSEMEGRLVNAMFDGSLYNHDGLVLPAQWRR